MDLIPLIWSFVSLMGLFVLVFLTMKNIIDDGRKIIEQLAKENDELRERLRKAWMR